AKARQESEKIRGHADADATKIYADAYNRDPEFFSFLRSQDVYRASLKEGTTLLLNAEQPLFRHMQQ
ncbi:MAG: protease modulator HflC, partial [SAR324 cluster bacterium]|nr:protease modulator HflC [SAR324 cluster bacterium]